MVAGRIHADAGATVTTEQLDFYHREGYLHLRGVLPPDLVSLTEYVLSRWSTRPSRSGSAKAVSRIGNRISTSGTAWRSCGTTPAGRSTAAARAATG